MKSKFLLIFTVLFAVFFFAQPVLALDTNPTAAEKELNDTLTQYRQAKKNLTQTKDRLGAQADDPNNAEYLGAKKQHLLSTARLIVKYLNNLKDYLPSSGLSDSEKTNLSAQIDSNIQATNTAASSIDSAQNKEQLDNAAKSLKTAWQTAKPDSRRILLKTLNSSADKYYNEINTSSTKFNATVDTLKKQNKDTSRVESLISDYQNQISQAGVKKDAISAKLITFSPTNPDDKNAFKEVIQMLKDERQLLADSLQNYSKADSELKRLSRKLPDASPTKK